MSRVQIFYPGQEPVVRDDVKDLTISEDHGTLVITYEDDSTEELETAFVNKRRRPMPPLTIPSRRKPTELPRGG